MIPCSDDSLEYRGRLEELERENLALRDFAWAASHDLKEPLRGISLHLEWLANSLNGQLEAPQAQHLEHALKSAQIVASVLTAVESYVRLRTEAFEWTTVDCGDVVANVTLLLRCKIIETGGSVTWNGLPCVRSSETLLTHVFLNLVDNAIRYRAKDPPRIKIAGDLQGNEWNFSVIDNGIGIDEKYREYIFEPFGRLNSRRTSGSGIGLALCRTAVERLGGRIWAEASQSGGGSVFRFTLPAET